MVNGTTETRIHLPWISRVDSKKEKCAESVPETVEEHYLYLKVKVRQRGRGKVEMVHSPFLMPVWCKYLEFQHLPPGAAGFFSKILDIIFYNLLFCNFLPFQNHYDDYRQID